MGLLSNRLIVILLASLLLSSAQVAVKTGPEVGAKIPSFELPDQQGTLRNFENLRGPKGLVLAFLRSADW